MFPQKLVSTSSLLLFTGMAHIPIALEYGVRMWKTGHYQFFPLIIAVIAWFWYQLSDDLRRSAESPQRFIQTIVLLGNLGLVFIATLLQSSFIGAVSMVSLLAVTFYSLYGLTGLRRAFPLVFLSWFAIPLPARLDSLLVFKLQFVASELGSWILDAFQQIHFREGVVLQTETHGFMTEEACSGIRSLFSSLAGIAVYGVAMSYPWWRHLFNLGQAVFWVIVGNAFRVAIVVYISENYSDRVASGVPHELLGLFIFLLIFLLSISTDRLFGAFLSEPTNDSGYPDVVPESEVSFAGITSDQGVSRSGTAPPPWVAGVVIPISVMIFLFGAKLTIVQTNLNRGIATYLHKRLSPPREHDLPSQMGDWRLVSFHHNNRGKEKLQAEDSFVWTFKKDGLTALISIDCPWDVWHDLSNCYSGLGWTTQAKHFFPGGDTLETDEELGDLRFSQLKMNKAGGETGVVLFSSVDARGNIVAPVFSSGFFSVESVCQQLVSNFAAAFGLPGDQAAGLKGYQLPLSTLQLYCTPETQITSEQIRELRQLFVDVRARLIQSMRFNSP